MQKEHVLFLRIMSDFLCQRKSEFENDNHQEILFDLATKHQLQGILYYQIKDCEQTKLIDRYKSAFASCVFYHVKLEALFNDLKEAFQKKNIPFFMMKGFEIAKLYPVPALRVMGDLDIVVHPQDREAAHTVLLEMGAVNSLKQITEWMYSCRGMAIELHDRMLYDEPANSETEKQFMNDVWNYVSFAEDSVQGNLDWNFHFIFLILHIKKHLIHKGIGFRQFMDLVVVTQKCELDWEWITQTLSTLGLLQFARICMSLCKQWFSVDMPLSIELDSSFFETATGKIFSDGVFGFNNKENHNNTILKQLSDKGRFITVVERLFPPYSHMSVAPYCAFLKGRPYLLPAAWLYRFYRGIRFGRIKEGKRYVRDSFVSNKEVLNREKELRMWGL